MKQNLLISAVFTKNFILLAVLLFSSFVFSQVENTFEPSYNISIPSPNAASFTSQIETPVSLFSGKVSYSIPVYTIKENNLTMPIALSYTASGFKPNAHPGWVGGGFSLNAGGVITRKVRGLNDDLCEFYDVNSASGNNHVVQRNGYCYSNSPPNFVDFEDSDSYSDMINNNLILGIEDFPVDPEPDDFYFSFGSYSGKFFITDSGTPIVVSNTQNLKVEVRGLYKESYITHNTLSINGGALLSNLPTAYSFSGFRIITSEGMIYEFGCKGGTNLKNVERSQNAMSIDTRLVNDAWYLSKITTSTGKEIASFEYLQNEWNTNDLVSETTSGWKTISNTPDYEPIRQIALTRSFQYIDTYAGKMTMSLPLGGKIIHPCYLSKIITKNSEINFHTSISEEQEHHHRDISNYIENMFGNYLGSSKDLGSNNNYHTIRARFFNGSTNPSQVDLHSTINWLQLDSITVNEKVSGQAIKTSRFYYTQNKYDRLRLLKYQENESPPYLFEYLNLTNHYLNEPETNGYRFDSWYGTFNVDNLGFYGVPVAPYNELLAGYEVSDSSSDSPGYYYNYVPYSALVYGSTFFSSFMNRVSEDIGLTMNIDELQRRSSHSYDTYRIQVEELLSGSTGSYVGGQLNYSIDKIHTPNGGVIEFEYEQHRTAYLVHRNIGLGTTEIKDRARHTSGIRIMSIKKYDAENPTKFTERKFLYDTGILFHEKVNFIKMVIGLQNVHSNSVYTSGSHAPASTNDKGSHIGYSKVTEELTNQDNEYKGKTVHYFNNYKNHSDLYSQKDLDNKKDEDLDLFHPFNSAYRSSSVLGLSYYPSVVFPLNSNNLKVGKLKCKEVYDENNIVERTCFEYSDSEYFNDSGTSVTLEHIDKIFASVAIFDKPLLRLDKEYTFSSIYDYYFHPSVVKNKITTRFYNNDSITTRYKYNYEYDGQNTNQLQLISENFTNSLGEEFTTSYTYPLQYARDLIGNSDVFKNMYNKNLISKVITKTVSKEDIIIGGNLNTYRFGDLTKGEDSDQIVSHKLFKLLPKDSLPTELYDIDQNIDLSTWDEEVEFVNYDEYNNLLQYSKADDINVSYIYGYNNTLPIAKIENVAYSEIPNIDTIKALSDEDDDHGIRGSETNEDALRVALDTLRSIEGAMATTYTYDPLIGLTSMTDTNGRTTYYEYDPFGRLKYVKDQDGNILTKTQYNYKKSN